MLSIRTLFIAALLAATIPIQAQNSDRFRVAIVNSQGRESAQHLSTSPAFIVDFGPQTKSGRPEEFSAYKQSFGNLQVYPIPGNDLTASPWAKEGFTRTFQRLYRSFDMGDYHFVILDSTTRSKLGHFDNAQLKWLEDDLKKMKKTASAVVFTHHPIGAEKVYVDNEDSLLRVLAAYTVTAILCAQPDGKTDWRVNGIPCFALPDSTCVAEFSIARIRILRSATDSTNAETVAFTIPRESGARRRVAFGWDDANIPLLARRQFLAELRSEKKTVRNEELSAQYRIDDRQWTAMEEDRRIDPGRRGDHDGRFMARFETKGLGWGGHRLQIRIKAQDGEEYRRDEPFAVEELHNEPKRVWEFDAGEGISADLALAGDTLFAATLDGKVHAIDTTNGKKRWTVTTKGPIYAGLIESNGTLYAASSDHSIYAINTRSGHVDWRYEAEAPIVTSPAVSGNVVSIMVDGRAIALVDGKPSTSGSSETNTVSSKTKSGDLAVDLSSTGEITWSAGSEIRRFRYHLDPGFCLSRPEADSKRTYAASMNGTVYAISLP